MERNLSAAVEAKLKRVRISINFLKCGYAYLFNFLNTYVGDERA